jgi:thymidylate kinase
MNYPFIVLNGYQRCGKTTLGQNLAKELDGFYTEAQGRNINSSDYIIKYNAFLEANVIISTIAKEICKTKPFIVNRHFFMTKASHEYILGLSHGDLYVPKNILERLILPDAEIILTASKEEIVRRFSMTGKPLNKSNSWEFQFAAQQGVFCYLTEFNIPHLLLDTGVFGIDETLEKSISYVKKFMPH